jgi:hypothetical protein
MSIRPSRLSFVLVLSSAAALAACGSDGAGNDPDQLIGTWRELPNGINAEDPIESRDRMVFTADGSVQIIESDGPEVGTYTADDRDVTLSSGEDTYRVQYVVTEDRFMFGALTPDGDVDGLVGTWAGDARLNDVDISLVAELRADGTVTYERDSSDPSGAGDEVLEGTWRQDPLDLVMTFEIPSENGTFTANLHFQELPGRAIGGPLFERLE